MEKQRKLILYIAMSIDGYIATKDGDLGFLSAVEQEGEDYGYKDFTDSVDTIIMGRNTYDKLISMGCEYPLTNKEVYLITRRPIVGDARFKYYSGPLETLVGKLKSKPGKSIYCDGGAQVANELMKDDLIDEYIISVIPTMLGDGIRLFDGGRPTAKLKLERCTTYNSGLVQLHYVRWPNESK